MNTIPPSGARGPKYKSGTTIQREANVKVLNTTDEGIVEAIVSAYGNIDAYGDVVLDGAFDEDLEQWAASGDPIPAIWAHDWFDPFKHIGFVLEARSTEKGLWVRMQLDIADNPVAGQVYRLLKGRRVKQFSFAYDILEAGWAMRRDEQTGAEREVYELRKLHIIEVGPCLVGVNRETELLATKAEELAEQAKAGNLSFEQQQQLDRITAALAEVTTKSLPSDSSEDPPTPDGQEPDTAAADLEAPPAKSDAASDSGSPASSRPGLKLAQTLIASLEESE